MSALHTDAQRAAALHGPYRRSGWCRWERFFIRGFYLWAAITFAAPLVWHAAARWLQGA